MVVMWESKRKIAGVGAVVNDEGRIRAIVPHLIAPHACMRFVLSDAGMRRDLGMHLPAFSDYDSGFMNSDIF